MGCCRKSKVWGASLTSVQPLWPLIVSGAQPKFKWRVGRNAINAGMDDWLMLRCPKLWYDVLTFFESSGDQVNAVWTPWKTQVPSCPSVVSKGDQKNVDTIFKTALALRLCFKKKFKAMWHRFTQVTGHQKSAKPRQKWKAGVRVGLNGKSSLKSITENIPIIPDCKFILIAMCRRFTYHENWHFPWFLISRQKVEKGTHWESAGRRAAGWEKSCAEAANPSLNLSVLLAFGGQDFSKWSSSLNKS